MFCIGNLSKGSLGFVCDWATSWSLCRMATTRRLRHWHRTLKKRVRVLLRGNQLLLKGIQCYPMLLLCLCSYVKGHIQSKPSNLYNVCLMKTKADMHGIYGEPCSESKSLPSLKPWWWGVHESTSCDDEREIPTRLGSKENTGEGSFCRMKMIKLGLNWSRNFQVEVAKGTDPEKNMPQIFRCFSDLILLLLVHFGSYDLLSHFHKILSVSCYPPAKNPTKIKAWYAASKRWMYLGEISASRVDGTPAGHQSISISMLKNICMISYDTHIYVILWFQKLWCCWTLQNIHLDV